MNEGLGMQLDPSFRLTSVILPYAQRLLLRQYSPRFWTKRIGQAGMDAAWLASELPQQARRLLGELERGDLKIAMQLTDVEPVMRRMERLVNRLILAIITGAFIIGLGMLMAFFYPPGGQWAWVWFATGFSLVAVLGLYLAWSVLRPRRR
jgi:ubiquinone biosynthesis protein